MGKEGIQHYYFMMLQGDEVCLSCCLLFKSAGRAPITKTVDQTQAAVKSENAEPPSAPISTESANDVIPMAVDEPTLESA